jgi:hypothetical protein
MHPKKSFKYYLLVCSIFAIAMAYLESTIVVYLREIYYPGGFAFPLSDIPTFIYFIEIGREAATIVMLWAISRLIAKNVRELLAYFAFNFGVWDIWYYIWLKILLNWPASLLDWDVLFLIPVPWLSPVLAPLLVSLALILAAYIILKSEDNNKPLVLSRLDWILEITAGLIVILSFLTEIDVLIMKQKPVYYPWWLFSVGMVVGLVVFLRRAAEARRVTSGSV